MKTKITVICENNVYSPLRLIAEHGLSFLIETGDATLFDTGQGLGLINNLEVLGKDPDYIDRVILSHGHYDHTGGLLIFLESRTGKTPVFLHTTIFNKKWEKDPDNEKDAGRGIGMSYPKEIYETAGADFHFIDGFSHITESISAVSGIKRPEGWKSWDKRLKQRIDGRMIDDPFMDDLSLLIETGSGPVVLLGCGHTGIIEILNDISMHSGYQEFYAVIGGTHLSNAPEEYIDKSIDTLKSYRIKKIAPAHCSGFKIAHRFASEFKNEFEFVSVGIAFEF